jgi:hypothetical protein
MIQIRKAAIVALDPSLLHLGGTGKGEQTEGQQRGEKTAPDDEQKQTKETERRRPSLSSSPSVELHVCPS